ncbi:hypothetical protein MKZ19_11420 [Shouchella clausii]|jgi:hypothetical protein|uniref:DNA-binding protein n=1 Tax=Shouchella rhizosphaerae TaxID=866786 RepID=A0ABZ2CS13_9BACI|nr:MULTISPECIES: hypothetical protein [Shouchella]KKI87982.1 DNA-binding protein [Shouchella clausii]MBX0319717.1 hypothetical protein [Shouchella clausii]PAF10596.1 hypothetical protein CHH65_06550 [Shouchella clausii]SHL09325.1 hypothetical protein SAMN05192535_0990 [Shouchella rhizosphaerae]GIN07123.1 hypothetical protein J1TS1_12680 [Shouchella clausii]
MNEPTKKQIMNKLELVLKNQLTREEVADWASEYTMQEKYDVSDMEVWKMLMTVSGLDLQDSPGEYLHNDDDIRDWIKKFSNN